MSSVSPSGEVAYEPIVVERTCMGVDDLYAWHARILAGAHERKTVVITQQNSAFQTVRTITLSAAWPSGWELPSSNPGVERISFSAQTVVDDGSGSGSSPGDEQIDFISAETGVVGGSGSGAQQPLFGSGNILAPAPSDSGSLRCGSQIYFVTELLDWHLLPGAVDPYFHVSMWKGGTTTQEPERPIVFQGRFQGRDFAAQSFSLTGSHEAEGSADLKLGAMRSPISFGFTLPVELAPGRYAVELRVTDSESPTSASSLDLRKFASFGAVVMSFEEPAPSPDEPSIPLEPVVTARFGEEDPIVLSGGLNKVRMTFNVQSEGPRFANGDLQVSFLPPRAL